MKPKVIGLGAGGHAKVLIEALGRMDTCEVVGLLDANPGLRGRAVLGTPVLGGDDMMSQLRRQGVTHFFVGVGSTGDSTLRRRLYQNAIQCGLEPVEIIHPGAWVSASAKVGRGVCILACAVVNADARFGDNVIVNTGAIVEHDCVLGAHVHIATGACLAGGVSVGEGSHIGIGASVRQNIRIGMNAIVGAGAVVVKEVRDEVVVAGVPARIIRPAR
jgi:UDP-perosamine 4-acetyltransferase